MINGGFEEGWIGWGHGGELSQTIVLTDRFSGRFSALLGSPDYPCRYVPVGSAWLEQTVCVPSTVSPTLTFSYEIWTYDRNKKLSRLYDLFDVEVDGVQVFSDMNKTEPYGCEDPVTVVTGVGSIDLGAYRGKRVVIRFENWNLPDRPYNTWTYVDDVRIHP